ncbi:hypothetical protein SDC9_197751 [bioreactor metagenome]|uniref:Uncharacterized protein n=1 Tax=bioreactor metagenome TaxID=1076179 RepID=A0A645IFQ9_9ZZZZ
MFQARHRLRLAVRHGHRQRVHRTRTGPSDSGQHSPFQRGMDAHRRIRGKQESSRGVRELQHGGKLADGLVEHRDQSGCLGADFRRGSDGQPRAPVGAVPSDGAADRAAPPDPGMGEEILPHPWEGRDDPARRSGEARDHGRAAFLLAPHAGFRGQQLEGHHH